MAEQFRTDLSRLSSKSVTTLPGGGIRIPARPTRSGIFEYRRADGTIRRELRRPSEVFSADSLATLRDAPLLEGHPAIVTAEVRGKLSRGHVSGEARQDGRFVSTDLAVTSTDLIPRIDSGEMCELSCGYSCETVETPGEYEGQRYDAEQIRIRYNHVGIGPKGWGRAGPEVALRLDSGEDLALRLDSCYSEIDPSADQAPPENPMKFRLDGKDYDSPDEYAAAWQAKHDALQGRLDALAETHKAEVTRLDGQLQTYRQAEAKSARAELEARAAKITKAVKLDGLDDDAARRAVILAAKPGMVLDGRSADYVLAVFDQLAESGQRADGIDSVLITSDKIATTRAVRKDSAHKTGHTWAATKETV